MVDSKQDRLAKEVVELSISFKMALSNKRKYPMAEFNSFVAAARHYIEALGKDPLIHRDVVTAHERFQTARWAGRAGSRSLRLRSWPCRAYR